MADSDNTTNSQLYTAPDIRRQTIDEMEAHIMAKRSRRLVLLQTFQQKQQTKLHKLRASEQLAFDKRVDRTRKAIEAINTAIATATRALQNLEQTNHNLVNIEGELFRDDDAANASHATASDEGIPH